MFSPYFPTLPCPINLPASISNNSFSNFIYDILSHQQEIVTRLIFITQNKIQHFSFQTEIDQLTITSDPGDVGEQCSLTSRDADTDQDQTHQRQRRNHDQEDEGGYQCIFPQMEDFIMNSPPYGSEPTSDLSLCESAKRDFLPNYP